MPPRGVQVKLRRRRALRATAPLAATVMTAVVLAGCSSSSHNANGNTGQAGTSATSGATPTGTPIVIGYISDLTGVASSTFSDGPGGAQAVIDQANAAGGIDGHPLKLVVKDDSSSPTGNQSAAQELIQNDHAMVVINYSSFAFGGNPALAKAGVPVVGSAFDGPEWANPQYPNLFTWAPPSESPVNGKLHTWTGIGNFLKGLGVKSFGGLGYGISPSSTDSILEAEAAAKSVGISTCYTNNSVNFGAVDFTADVLQIKQANCDAVAGSFVEASDLALSKALKQGGLTKTTQVFFTGYDQSTTATPADAQGFDGAWVQSGYDFSPPNAGGQAFLATLQKYDKSYPGGIPDFGVLGSAISTQLVVYGLKQAGSNPSSQSFTTNLRKVSSWDDNGLFPTPVSFTGFGTEAMFPQKTCGYFMQLSNGQWHAYNNGPVCGNLLTIPATS